MIPILLLAAGGLSSATAADLHDPLAVLESHLDAPGKTVLSAFDRYDATRITTALQTIEQRHGSPAARAEDDDLLAQGYLELLVIQRFYARHLPESMPAVLKGKTPATLSEKGLRFAGRFGDAHPEHSDIQRIRGELISFQIDGMVSGMTKGPLAKKAVDRALKSDPDNGWARFARARMLFHNPVFAGGDKEKALREFRVIATSMPRLRVYTYLALSYELKGMYSQARYFIKKALHGAPGNPQAAWLLDRITKEAVVAREK